MQLTKEQIEQFDKDGYLFFPNLFSKEELPLYRVMRAIALNSTVASLPTEEMAVFHGFPLPTLPFQSLLSAGDVLNQCTFQFDFDTLHLPRFVPLSS